MQDDDKPELFIPEPPFRPGDTPDFSHIHVRKNDNLIKPDVLVDSYDTEQQAGGLIRVLDMQGHASGPWHSDIRPDTLRKGLRAMLLTRLLDDRMFQMQRQGKLSFYLKCHGEEAVAVAQALALRKSDMVFPTYRQQGILIARDYPLLNMMCQCLSNQGDPTLGRQMPALYSARDHGFFSVSGNLGTQYIQAVGWAMATAYQHSDDLAAAYIGDGSTAEGDFHYALNFASTYRAPVILNIVNNQWAISSFQGIAGGQSKTFASRGLGYGLASLRVDGNDFLAVYAVTRWAAERARRGGGATVIEHYTYRAEGHSSSDDPARYRPSDEAAAWPYGDPIERLTQHLIRLGEWSEEKHQALTEELQTLVLDTYKKAEAMGAITSESGIDPASMFEGVYEDMTPALREQARQAGY
ncbi:MAG: 3-methyl-2-oxobutanoate dehydrogenase (2-methylpropanoyl-transferring) subunit alpha [Gammaproteobacteria bacterium]|nr:3-methyl-2-oxobutanoate dehydrogenase (2-methylpropanoyl-transferring) subunit alpha [Gammaproteobacteria bacterium]